MLEVHNLYAGYDGRNILQDVSLQIPEGKITMMIGPNGCGKSTLLKTMAGIITPQSISAKEIAFWILLVGMGTAARFYWKTQRLCQ